MGRKQAVELEQWQETYRKLRRQISATERKLEQLRLQRNEAFYNITRLTNGPQKEEAK